MVGLAAGTFSFHSWALRSDFISSSRRASLLGDTGLELAWLLAIGLHEIHAPPEHSLLLGVRPPGRGPRSRELVKSPKLDFSCCIMLHNLRVPKFMDWFLYCLECVVFDFLTL